MSNAFSERIVSNKIMIANIKANQDRLTPWGLTPQYVTQMETLFNDVLTIDNNHEALKAQLKTMTADLNAKKDSSRSMNLRRPGSATVSTPRSKAF